METIIIRFKTDYLKNETHVQFHEGINFVIVKHNPQSLGIEPWYVPYKGALNNETEALDFFRKSKLTGKIADQDHVRDGIFRGFVDSIKGERRHFDPSRREAANLLYDIFDHYGNIARKPLDDETAAINDLARELAQPDATQAITLLGLTPWLNKLVEENTKFVALMSERYDETAKKTSLRMKTTRSETDTYYQAIISQIENQHLVGVNINENFIKELNAVIERFRNILAQEIGGRKSKSSSEAESTDAEN
jgi:hypothetical protein